MVKLTNFDLLTTVIFEFWPWSWSKMAIFDHLTTAILKFWPWSWSKIFDHLTMTPGRRPNGQKIVVILPPPFFLSVGAHFTSPFWRGGYVRLVANVSWSSSGLQESDRTWLGEGFARLVLPEDITCVLWPGGSATSRRTSAISDPSSVDSLEPVGESGVETPYRNGVAEYCEELPPHFASGPAR